LEKIIPYIRFPEIKMLDFKARVIPDKLLTTKELVEVFTRLRLEEEPVPVER
jgi:hypothetical protein